MKKILTIIGLLSISLSAFADCEVEVSGKLASNAAVVLDQTDAGIANFTYVLAEAQLRREAGATCAEVKDMKSIIILNTFSPSGPDEGKLIQTVEIYKK